MVKNMPAHDPLWDMIHMTRSIGLVIFAKHVHVLVHKLHESIDDLIKGL